MVRPAMTHYCLAGVNKPMQTSSKHEDDIVQRFVLWFQILISRHLPPE
jgi:hypothetical protein